VFSAQQQRPETLYETPPAGTVKRLNVEHRTSNIECRILMTLRFICFKTSERRILKDRFARAAQALAPRVVQLFLN